MRKPEETEKKFGMTHSRLACGDYILRGQYFYDPDTSSYTLDWHLNRWSSYRVVSVAFFGGDIYQHYVAVVRLSV